jgi:hypothetical protein
LLIQIANCLNCKGKRQKKEFKKIFVKNFFQITAPAILFAPAILIAPTVVLGIFLHSKMQQDMSTLKSRKRGPCWYNHMQKVSLRSYIGDGGGQTQEVAALRHVVLTITNIYETAWLSCRGFFLSKQKLPNGKKLFEDC